jgi:hypothetical protein
MHFLNDTEPIFLHTDASDYGIGGYLFQVVGGIDHPIVSNSYSWELFYLLCVHAFEVAIARSEVHVTNRSS